MFSNSINVVKAVLCIFVLLGLSATARADNAEDVKACSKFIKEQHYDSAVQSAQELLKRADLDATGQMNANLCLGQAYYSMNKAKEALPAFEQAMEINNKFESTGITIKNLAVIANFLGLTYIAGGDLKSAERYFQTALKGFDTVGDKDSEPAVLNNLALIAQKQGDLKKALTLFNEVLPKVSAAMRPTVLSNIALIHFNRKEYQQAIALLKQAIEGERRNGNAHAAAKLQLNLGVTYQQIGKHRTAEKELLAGLNVVHLVGDKSFELNFLEYLAKLSHDQKKNSEARQWYAKEEALLREMGHSDAADKIAAEAAKLGK